MRRCFRNGGHAAGCPLHLLVITESRGRWGVGAIVAATTENGRGGQARGRRWWHLELCRDIIDS
jgi:hypothetical protein